jgi:type I restriction-modification system DNA methylase subunit
VHQTIFSSKYLKQKLSNFALDNVDNFEERLKIIEDWANAIRHGTVNKAKEEELKPEFLIKFFGTLLDYEYRAGAAERNLHIEKKSVTDSTKPDATLGYFTNTSSDVRVVIEIKDGRTDLDKPQNRLNDKRTPVEQAFSYVAKSGGNCKWVIVSNFKELRLYHASDQGRYELFDLVELSTVRPLQQKFFYLLDCDRLVRRAGNSLTDTVYTERITEEQKITKEFYIEYKTVRGELFAHLVEYNSNIPQEVLFAKAQKILDRLIFIRFCECLNLIPPETLATALKSAEETFYKSDTKLWDQIVGLCRAIDGGWPEKSINRFNGGLFAHDKILDEGLDVKNPMVKRLAFINKFDFESDLNVNILGHIFEQSISDIEETKAQISGEQFDKKKGKRKKEGIFYTPEYITRYIVKEAVGGWLEDRKKELGFDKLPSLTEDEIQTAKKRKGITLPTKVQKHLDFWKAYEDKLRHIKVLDPACGSGAFLVQVFDYLLREGQYVNKEKERLTGKPTLFDLQKHILTENIYGVDLNEESVEITKLSLWLKTADKSKELTTLDNNIQCGNSLIDDPVIAGDKAFNWTSRFSEATNDNKFDVVIGNPPYVYAREKISEAEKAFYTEHYKTADYQINTYILFIEKAIDILSKDGRYAMIVPNAWLMISSGRSLREVILETSSIEEIINLSGFSFEGVNVETIIISARKESSGISNSVNILLSQDREFIYSHTLQQDDFRKTSNYEFYIFSDASKKIIVERMNNGSVILDDISVIKAGLKAYESGKGIPQQTAEDVKKRPFDYDYAYDKDTLRYLEGRDVGRYHINWSGGYLRYGKFLAAPRKIEIFTSPKIVIREITGKYPRCIIASYSEEVFLFNMSNIPILEAPDANISLKYILAVLNSRLLSFYFISNTAKSVRQMFPKLILQDLRKFPFKIISLEEQAPFIERVDTILAASSLMSKIFDDTLKLMIAEFPAAKQVMKLQNWEDLSWDRFTKELKKARVNLTLKQKGEWMSYFDEKRMSVAAMRSTIDKIDEEIDALVYELYGLTEEEIKIVESN